MYDRSKIYEYLKKVEYTLKTVIQNNQWNLDVNSSS